MSKSGTSKEPISGESEDEDDSEWESAPLQNATEWQPGPELEAPHDGFKSGDGEQLNGEGDEVVEEYKSTDQCHEDACTAAEGCSKPIEENQNLPQPKKPKAKRKRKRLMTVNLSTCKYDCVRRVCKKFGFREVDDSGEWTLFWTDYSVTLERVMDMKPYQKINHFPGMSEICRKDSLARNMNRLWKQFPKEYGIFPRTWCLPADYGEFQVFYRQKRSKTYILKPDTGSQGRGIFITKNPKQDVKPGEDLICQQYISKPFLIDGLKFDLRVYILVTSCDPLRIFMFKDGLGRFATVKYNEPTNSNLENVFMHLTNYAIQKTSGDFLRNEDTGSKRRITTVNKWFQDNGYNVDQIWAGIDDAIIKTLISAHPVLKHNYRTCFPNHQKSSACFEILGFDVLLDKKLKPWILEVNHSPSFTTDSALDREIKDSLISDSLRLANFSVCDKRKFIEEEKRRVRQRLLQKRNDKQRKARDNSVRESVDFLDVLQKFEDQNMGNFRRIYPELGNQEKYHKYFESSCSLFQETAASRARSEVARLQREEIKAKTQKIEEMRKKNAGKPETGAEGLRPESPRARRKRLGLTKRHHIQTQHALIERTPKVEQRYSCLLHVIDEDEEVERIEAMIQRDNLVRSLGICNEIVRMFREGKQNTKDVPKGQKDLERDAMKPISLKTSTGAKAPRSFRDLPHKTMSEMPIITPYVTSLQRLTSTGKRAQEEFTLLNSFRIGPSEIQRPRILIKKTMRPGMVKRLSLSDHHEMTSLSESRVSATSLMNVNKIVNQNEAPHSAADNVRPAVERAYSRTRLLSTNPTVLDQNNSVVPSTTYVNVSHRLQRQLSSPGLSLMSSAAPFRSRSDPSSASTVKAKRQVTDVEPVCRAAHVSKLSEATSVRLQVN